MSDEKRPTPLEAYESFAEAYATRVDTKPHNAYYERPATLSLLPDVRGRRVLDAGCGPGVYAEWLADRRAEVVAFDASEKMLGIARERLGDKATMFRADLGQPLDVLEDESFDVVLSALALDYVEDWGATFREFHRLTKPGGVLVFSGEHPCSTFVRYVYRGKGNYFETELVGMEWTGFGEKVYVPSYRRSLGAAINPLLRAGFVLDRLLEPTPTEQFRQADPEDYAKLSRMPGFWCVRAVKSRKEKETLLDDLIEPTLTE